MALCGAYQNAKAMEENNTEKRWVFYDSTVVTKPYDKKKFIVGCGLVVSGAIQVSNPMVGLDESVGGGIIGLGSSLMIPHLKNHKAELQEGAINLAIAPGKWLNSILQ